MKVPMFILLMFVALMVSTGSNNKTQLIPTTDPLAMPMSAGEHDILNVQYQVLTRSDQVRKKDFIFIESRKGDTVRQDTLTYFIPKEATKEDIDSLRGIYFEAWLKKI